MRLFFIGFILFLSIGSFAQSSGTAAKPVIYSASSDWQKVTLRSTARLQTDKPLSSSSTPTRPPVTQRSPVGLPPADTRPTGAVDPAPTEPGTAPATKPAPTMASVSSTNRRATGLSSGFHPAFTGDFATNRNGWKAGVQGDYHYQIGLGRYSIRKRKASTQQVAFSFVPLPAEINLNLADDFIIKVDVMADSGRVAVGGVLFGVADSLNFCAFTTNAQGEVSIVRVTNGKAVAEYMPGDFFAPGVAIDKNRNRLTIRRESNMLYFYVNEQEVRSSPYPFKPFSGNGIGMTASGYWTSFQKLSVVLGP